MFELLVIADVVDARRKWTFVDILAHVANASQEFASIAEVFSNHKVTRHHITVNAESREAYRRLWLRVEDQLHDVFTLLADWVVRHPAGRTPLQKRGNL